MVNIKLGFAMINHHHCKPFFFIVPFMKKIAIVTGILAGFLF